MHNMLLRKHALGYFKQLVRAVTIDLARLKYQNGNANSRKAPNENYGRELQDCSQLAKDRS